MLNVLNVLNVLCPSGHQVIFGWHGPWPVGRWGTYVMAEAAHSEVQEETPELSAASKVVALRADWCEKSLCLAP